MPGYPHKRVRSSRDGQDKAPPGGRDVGERSFAFVTANAEFIPDRNRPLQWESPAAEMLGDPPIGRRAIDCLQTMRRS